MLWLETLFGKGLRLLICVEQEVRMGGGKNRKIRVPLRVLGSAM